ncbi:hypothetical protein [Elioraea sp.]|uniref:hypothetical protein n=1 Tax=Elioraea sp. TaxID=2185103 RepID=UPI0025C144BC|nr:hypothetical protein [Elioraea sp.]
MNASVSSLEPVGAMAGTAAAPITIGKLGPFAVSLDGTLEPNDPEIAPRFGFRWRGRRVAARMLAGWQVEFDVIAAHVPFTAESTSARPRVLAAVAALRDGLPPGWRLRLAPDHSVHLETVAPLGGPATATKLVTAATTFVLALAPCLDLLDDEGARAA